MTFKIFYNEYNNGIRKHAFGNKYKEHLGLGVRVLIQILVLLLCFMMGHKSCMTKETLIVLGVL